MSNPLDTFFGPSVVSKLRRQPRSLKHIAERTKRYLMAISHPDLDQRVEHDVSAEVSESFAELVAILEAPAEDRDHEIDNFLSRQRGGEERLKITIRELRRDLERLQGEVSAKDQRIQELSVKVSDVQGRLLSWIYSSQSASVDAVPEGSVSRNDIHGFRVVALYSLGPDSFYRGYEFDRQCNVVYTIKSDDQDVAAGRARLKRNGKSAIELGRGRKGLAFFLGSTAHSRRGTSFFDIAEGVIIPYAAPNLLMVFGAVYRGQQQDLRHKADVGGRIVEIIPLTELG